jgi:hypothetical protein
MILVRKTWWLSLCWSHTPSHLILVLEALYIVTDGQAEFYGVGSIR